MNTEFRNICKPIVIQNNEVINPTTLKLLPKIFFDKLHDSKKLLLHHSLYEQYSYVLNNVPSDFQGRVNQIAECGFLIDDIKESLRLSNYDVQKAKSLLISQNSTKLSNNKDMISETTNLNLNLSNKVQKKRQQKTLNLKLQKQFDFSHQKQKCGKISEILKIQSDSSKISKVWNQRIKPKQFHSI